METQSKTCPKCPSSPEMVKNDKPFIIPALVDSGEAPISNRLGGPVQIYECPQCHLVELYHLEL